jgi:hypothetical protein
LILSSSSQKRVFRHNFTAMRHSEAYRPCYALVRA